MYGCRCTSKGKTVEETLPKWPATGAPPHTWTVAADVVDFIGSRRTQAINGKTYTSSVPAQIAELNPDDYVSRATLRAASGALQDLVAFAERTSRLPPFMGAVLLRSESASSSQIENLSASARRIAEAELGLDVPKNAELVVANTRAMHEAINVSGSFSEGSILQIHSHLMAEAPQISAGQYRNEPVWIGGSNWAPTDADFVGPDAHLIQDAMTDLVHFIRDTNANALVATAVAHAQFETIHPFEDGNGRTGRALVHMVLSQRGYGAATALPISAGLLATNIDRYFQSLNNYRAGSVDPIVTVFADAAAEAAVLGLGLAAQVEAVRDTWRSGLRARSDSAVWAVLDALFAHPVTSVPFLTGTLGVSEHALGRALRSLAEAGIIQQSGRDRHQKTWRAPEVLEILDSFARNLPRSGKPA